MLCPRCQTECPEENNFCHKCGADLHEQRVRDNLSLRLPSGHTDNKKPEFLPIQHSLTKAETEKAEKRPVSLSKEADAHKSAAGGDLAQRADFDLSRAEAGESVIGTEPGQAKTGISLAKESSAPKAAGLSLAKAEPAPAEAKPGQAEPEGSADVGSAAVFSPFSNPAQRMSLSKEPSGSAEGGESAGFAESASGAAETAAQASPFSGGLPEQAGAAERAEAAEKAEAVSSAGSEAPSGAAESSPEGGEVFVDIPQRVSVFSGNGVREGSKLNTQELVDKTLAGWNNLDVQPIIPEKRDEHVGLRVEDQPAKTPFSDAVQSAPKPEPAKPAGNETRVLNAEDGREIAGVNTDFRTVKNVFGGNASAAPASGPFAQRGQAGAVMNNAVGGAPVAPTSEAFSQREHAKAIINEVPRANSKGNDSSSAGKVGIIIASCGCLVVFALIALIFVVWILCF